MCIPDPTSFLGNTSGPSCGSLPPSSTEALSTPAHWNLMIPERKGEFPPPLSSTSLVKMSGMRVAQEESFIGLFSKVDSEGKAR